ncbi:MAG: alpha/beta hydrolase [Candidatus Caldarchaeales archaeon]
MEWQAHINLGSILDVNGVKTFHLSLGDNHPLLLIHGWGSSSYSWRRNYPDLSKTFKIVALDLPGFGNSAPLPSGINLDSVSSHIFNLLDQLDLRQTYLVGHSMGGVISAYLAGKRPERISKLVLESPSFLGRRPFFTDLVKNKVIAKILIRFLISKSFVRRGLRSSYGNPDLITEETIEGYYQSVVKSGYTLLEASDILKEFDIGILERITCPILFVLGEKDKWIPIEETMRIADRMNAQIAVIPGAGHIPHEERPQEFNRIIVEFLQGSGKSIRV